MQAHGDEALSVVDRVVLAAHPAAIKDAATRLDALTEKNREICEDEDRKYLRSCEWDRLADLLQ